MHRSCVHGSCLSIPQPATRQQLEVLSVSQTSSQATWQLVLGNGGPSVVLPQPQHAVYPVELQLHAAALALQTGIQLHLCRVGSTGQEGWQYREGVYWSVEWSAGHQRLRRNSSAPRWTSRSSANGLAQEGCMEPTAGAPQEKLGALTRSCSE